MQVQLARERWSSFWPEARRLFELHHAEVSRPGRMNLDVLQASQIDLLDLSVIVTARDFSLKDPPLLGYCIWMLGTDLEFAGVRTATQGPWYVEPEVRKTSPSLGIRLLRESLPLLRKLGVQTAFPHYWEKGGGARLGSVFRRLGAEPLETVWQLDLTKTIPVVNSAGSGKDSFALTEA